MSDVERKLVAILAADVAGYSRLMSEDEEGTSRNLSGHRKIIDALIEDHKGRIANTAGDSVLAEFSSPVEAMKCAIEIQEVLRTRNNNVANERKMLFRIGVNLGDVIAKDGDLLGDGVNIAARLQALAEPGGICFSGAIYDQIEGKLNLSFISIGDQTVKNIPRPVRAYRLGDSTSALNQPENTSPEALSFGRSNYRAIFVSFIIVIAIAIVSVLVLFNKHAPQNANLVKTIGSNLFPILDFAFYKNDQYLVSAGSDNAVRVWDLTTGSEVNTLIGHEDQVNSVDVSPNGKMIVSGSDDKTIRLWHSDDGSLIKVLSGHTAPVECVVFSPDNKLIASSSDDKTVRIWSTETGALLKTLLGHTGMVMTVAFSPDGNRLLSSGRDMSIKFWDVHSGKSIRTLNGHTDYVESLEFSPNSQYAVSSSDDETLKLWDIATGSVIRTFSCSPGDCIDVTFSPDGKQLISASDDNLVHIWDVVSGQQLAGFSLGAVAVKGYSADNSATISSDGRYVASYSTDKNINIWKIPK